MELKPNEKVLMSDGKLYGAVYARWSRKRNCFIVATDEVDEDGEPIWLTGTEIVTIEKKPNTFKPTKENCTVLVDVCDSTEKAYAYYTGFYSTKGIPHKEWVSKAICYKDENGNVFKPVWAN